MDCIDRSRRTLIAGAAGAGVSLMLPRFAAAEEYPIKPITFICPWPAGGTADQSMRVICQVAAKLLKQPIAVENRAGAAGMIGAKAIAAARPDGYTIGQIPISVTRFAQVGSLQADPLKDFTYLARTSGQTFGIAVLAESKFKTLTDLLAAAKANPGKVSYAHAGVGGATHVATTQLATLAGVEFNAIAYKGGAAALNDTLGGQVDCLVDSGSWTPHVEAGKMRLLATFGDKRSQRFPNTPTVKESGYNLVVEAPNGIGAPAGLPPAVEKRLREAFKVAVTSDEFNAVAARIDAPLMYLDGPDYKNYVAQVYREETELIRRLNLAELMAKG